MADRIAELYKKSLDAGVLTEGLTEDMFREQTKTDEGLRSFYDVLRENGMKLTPWDTFRGKARGEIMDDLPQQPQQPAQPSSAQPAQQQRNVSATSANPTFSGGQYAFMPAAARANQQQVEQEESKRQALQRQAASTLPTTQQDRQTAVEIQRLGAEATWGKPNGVSFGVDPKTGLPTITKTEGDGVHLYTGEKLANQDQIDQMRASLPDYMKRPNDTEEHIIQNIQDAWTTNTEEGRQARVELEQGHDALIKELQGVFDATERGREINTRYSNEYQQAFNAVYGRRYEQDKKRLLAQYQSAFDQSDENKQIIAQYQNGTLTEAQANAKLNEAFQRQFGQRYQQEAGAIWEKYNNEFSETDKAKDINARHNDEYNRAFAEDMEGTYKDQMSGLAQAFNEKMMAANGDFYEGRMREMKHNVANKMIENTAKFGAKVFKPEKVTANGYMSSVGSHNPYPDAHDEYKSAYQNFLYKAEQRMNDMSIDKYQFGDFSKNVAYDLGGILESTMSFGLSDWRDRKVLTSIFEKVNAAAEGAKAAGKDPQEIFDNPSSVLNDKERAVYDAYCTYLAADIARQTDTSYLADAAKLTADMIPFMVEVGAMNGIFGGLNRATQNAITRGIARSIVNKLPRGFMRTAARGLTGLTVNLVGAGLYAAESGAMALVLPRTYANMLQNKIDVADKPGAITLNKDRLVINDFDVNSTSDAFFKAWRDEWKELFTETGGVFQVGRGVIFKNPIAKQVSRKVNQTSLGKLIDTFSSGRYFELAKQMGYHGTYQEWTEEVEGTCWDYVFGDKDAFDKFFSEKTQIPMLISFSIPSVLGGGINAARELSYRREYKKATDNVLGLLQKYGYSMEDIDGIKQNLYTINVEDIPTEVMKMASMLTNADEFGEKYGEYTRLKLKERNLALSDTEKAQLAALHKDLFETANAATADTKVLATELTKLAYSEVALASIDRDIAHERSHAIEEMRQYYRGEEAEQMQQAEEQQEAEVQQDRQTQLRQQAEQQAQQEVQGMSHQDGNVYYVGIKGKDGSEGYAVSGNLNMQQDQQGMYSTSGRELVTVKMNDGSVQQVPADELVVRDIPVSADELMQERTDHYFAQYANNDLFHVGDKVYLKQNGQQSAESSTIVNINDEGIEVEIIDPNGQPNTTVIPHEQAAEMLSKAEGTEDGIVTYTMQDGNTIRLRDMGNGVYNTIVPDGEQPEIFTEEELAEAGAVRAEENSGQGEFVIPQEEGYEYGKPTNIRTSKKGTKLADITRTHIDKDGNKVTEVITIKQDGTNVISGSTIPLVGYRIAGMDAETFEGVEVVGFTKLTELPQRTRVVDGRDADGNNIYREQDAIGELILKDENGRFSATVPLIRTAPVGESNQNPRGLDTQTPMGNGNETQGAAPAYPTDEEGNPAWGQIEVPQAAQILYDTFKQNNAAAISYADDQLKEAEKVQRQAAKQKSHSLNIAQRIAEDEQNAAFKAAADAAVKYWQDVKLAIGQIKTAEEQAAQAAQQQLLQQAREQRSKTEEGTVTAPTMAERYAAADKIEGNTGTMTLPDGRELSGRYMLIAPQGVTPSHDVTKNFQRSEGYPVTSNGQSINDRDYTADKEEQQKVVSIAQNFNGNAIKNMPVISDEGLVYNGNGRMMAGQLAALNGTDAAYTQSLMNNAAQYGFTPEQVASIPNARVVFQLDERLPYSTQSLAIFNEQETQTQSNTGKAAGYARKLTPQAVSEVLAAVDGFNTIDAFFSDKKAPFNLINSLINAGIIAQREKAEMVDGDKLSATGRERLSNILFGTVFDNETIRLMGDDAALKNSIMRALPQILDNKSLGEFSLESDINDAIRLLYEVRRAGVPFQSFVRQTVMSEDGEVHTAAENYSPYQLLLAEEMTDGGVDAFRDVLNLYNEQAKTIQGGQVDIFGNLPTPTELKNLILQRYGKEPTETERPSAGRQTDNAPASAPASNEQEVIEPEKPLKSLADVKKFMDSIGYEGTLSKVLTENAGKKFVKFQANGVVTPNIYLGETTPRDILEQFYLYDNVMGVNIPADLQAEFDKEKARAQEVRNDLYASDREQIKQMLTEEGIPFVDVVDSERGSRIIFTDHKNENGNYTDWMDVSDADQAREDIAFIRAKAESFAPKHQVNVFDGAQTGIVPTNSTADAIMWFRENVGKKFIDAEKRGGANSIITIKATNNTDVTLENEWKGAISERTMPLDEAVRLMNNYGYSVIQEQPAQEQEIPEASNETQTEELTPLEAAKKRKAAREAAKEAKPKNTIFTDEAYEKAKARMKARLNRLNMGLDPEMLADQIVIAGYHVERGARRFADFARALIYDFGDGIRQYAKQMYNYLRDIPEGEPYRAEMDDYATVMAFDIDNFDKNERKNAENAENILINQNNLVTLQPNEKEYAADGLSVVVNTQDYTTYLTPQAKEVFAKLGQKERKPHKRPELSYISFASRDGVMIPLEVLKSDPAIIEAQAKIDSNSGSLELTQEQIEEYANRLLEGGDIKSERKAFIIIGRPAGGKSSVFAEPLAEQNSARIIDSDEVKPWLDGYDNGDGAGYVQKASDLVMQEALWRAALNGDNVVIPKIGGGSIIDEITLPLKELGYTVELYYNEVAPESSYMRAMARFAEKGRYLSLNYLAGIGDKPTKTFNNYSTKDIYGTISELSSQKVQDLRARLARIREMETRLLSERLGRGGRSISTLGISELLESGEPGRGRDSQLTGTPLFDHYEWKNNDVPFGTKPKTIKQGDNKPTPPSGPNEGKKTTYEKGQKVKYYNKVDKTYHDAEVESVNADGTYNITTPSPIFGDIHMNNISEDRLSTIEEPKEEKPARKLGEVRKSKHTQTGEDLWIVNPTEHVGKPEFLEIKRRAKANNGYWSNYKENKGFVFYSEEDANRFNNISDEEFTTNEVLADTETAIKQAETVAAEAASIETPEQVAPEVTPEVKEEQVTEVQQVIEQVDDAVEQINEQLAVLGYYEADTSDPFKFHESYGYLKSAEAKALKDVDRLAKQLAADLGVEVNKRKKLATANIAPAGGDISFRLPIKDGLELYVHFGINPNRGLYYKPDGIQESYVISDMYWRVENPSANGSPRYLTGNQNYGSLYGPYGQTFPTYEKLLKDIRYYAKDYLPKVEEASAPVEHLSDLLEEAKKRKAASDKRKKDKTRIPDGQQVLSLFDDAVEDLTEAARQEEQLNDNNNGNINESTEGAGRTTPEGVNEVGSNGIESNGGQQTGSAQESSGRRNTGRVAESDAGQNGGNAQQPTTTGTEQPRSKRGSASGTAGGVSSGNVVEDQTVEHGDRRADDGSLRTPKEKNTPKNTRNYLYPEDAGEIDNMSPMERLETNVEALEVLRTLLTEDREATQEERATLGKLRGWGGINVPDNYTAKYTPLAMNPLQKRLVAVVNALDPNGDRKLLDSLRTASLTSYYTPIPIARAMHAIAEQAGYKGNGNMLDPSMGNGVFEGSMAKGVQQSTNIRGVELDWLTGQIAQKLYPDARINITGFQDAHIPQDYYDYVVSNIPFGSLQITDLDWQKNPSPIRKAAQGKIHNYFAVKMIESTRPGGLCVIMTSNAIMDTMGNQMIRQYITENCEVLGAIRLPNNTFKGAGTRVVTDVIYLRKFRNVYDSININDNVEYANKIKAFFENPQLNDLPDGKGGTKKVRYNSYFMNHAENVIGTPVAGGQYTDDAYDQESDLTTDEIAKKIEEIGRRFIEERKKRFGNAIVGMPIRSIDIKERIKERYVGNGKYEDSGNIVVMNGLIGKLETVKDGNVKQLMFAEQKLGSATVAQVTDYANLRSLLKQLIHVQIENYTSDRIAEVRKQMQQAYTAYTKKYGKLCEKKNAFIEEDIDGYQVRALEQWKDGKFVGMADIYTKNTIASERDMNDVSDPQAAVLNSLAEYGNINTEYLQRVLGDNFAEACKGLIFEDPSHQGEYIARDVYLSGDVVTKLEYARQMAEEDSRFQENVTALEAIQPKRKEFGEFPCHMGARWIPVQIYNDFLNEIFGIRGNWKGQKTGITYVEATNEYIFNFVPSEFGGNAAKYATSRKSASDIFQAALLDKDITVKYKDDEGKEHTDQEATDAARDKVAELREAFEDWVPQKPERVQQLTDTYNSVFNRHVLPTYNGQHLNIVGLQGMTLRPHQKDAVWRIINQRGGIVDHIVGAGKSLVMQASIMEMRRMGIAKKPMILALKSTTQQIANEFRQAFPAARVLAPTEADFSTQNRKRFLAQIAVNDYDCIILSHEQYSALDHTEAIKRSFIEDQIAQLDNLLEYLYGQKDESQLTKKQIKGLEKRKENLKERLKKLELIRTDEEFVFENLGVDYLFVDECQAFKNLMFQTSYSQIAGLGNPEGSERSTKLLYGVRALQEMHQGDMGTVFLSGTTITNSLSELYNIFNYLRPNEMARMGLNTFDAWASTFAVRSTEAEFGTTNELKEKSRFRKFEGIQELSRLYTEIADVRNDNNLELPKPKLHTVFVSIPISDTMKTINDAITDMVKNHNGSFFNIKPEREDKYPWSLSATNLAKLATLSPKLIDPSYDDENGKIFHVCENIKKIYDQFNDQKGVQLVFCDAGVPGPGKKYDAYTDIIRRLTKDYGIPRSEIADIHEAGDDAKRQALFKKVNDGKVRILIGGTKNMGTGVNVQKRVVAMHHLDIPWTPADVNQRNGRGSRQGNEIARDYNNNQVDAYYYAVERTLDTYRYQLQDVKGKMIDSFKMANVGVNEFDEGGGDDNMSPAEMVAILSGNPVILDKAKQDKLVDKLKRLQRSSVTEYARRKSEYELLQKSQSTMQDLIRRNAGDIETLKRNGYEPDAEGNWPTLHPVLSEYERVSSGKTFEKPTELGATIHARIKETGTAYLYAAGISAKVMPYVDSYGETKLGEYELQAQTYSGVRYTVKLSDDDTAAGQAMQNLLRKIYSNAEVYKHRLEEVNNKLEGADPGEYSFPRQAELDAALAKKREIDAEYNKLIVSDKKPKQTDTTPEAQITSLDYPQFTNQTEAQQLATAALVEVLNDNTDLDVFLATDEQMPEDAEASIVSDKQLMRQLEQGEKVKVYRAMVEIDGKLYPPMSSKDNETRKLRKPIELGQWEQAEERPDLAYEKDGKWYFRLRKDDGTYVDAAYNPYLHTSRSPLNDQFVAAYKRPNLVTVEVEVPVSELTSGYKADRAKDAVGEISWHSGAVSSQLAALGNPRKVILSRYDKPIRIVPDAEVAEKIAGMLQGTDIAIPYNVVTPSLRAELEKQGVTISSTPSGTVSREEMRKPDGTLYGWAIGDRIYLTKAGLNPNTPIHEYTHLWAKAMRRNNQEGWQSIVNIFKDTPFWQEVVEDENYASIRNNDDAICSEVLARYSGTRGAARMEEAAAEMLHEADQTDDLATFARTRRLISRVRQALSDFWQWVGVNLFGIKHFDSAEQVADRVLFDMLNGTELKPEDQTTTNNFKAWFGDWQNDPEHASKVVDKKGRPLVVYHGSPYTFTEFRAGRPIYAFNKRNLADQYRHRRGNLGVSMRPAPESSIVEGYMNLRNPFIFEVHGAHYRIAKQYVDYQLHGTPYSYGDKPEWISADDVVKMVQEDGRYDGVIFKDMYDNLFSTDKVRGDIYVAFNPNQIKSATENNGEFSTEDNDIERSVSRWTPEQMRAIQEWNDAHPHPQYQVGEKLDHYAQRLSQWEEARKQFRASMSSAKPSAEEAEKADRPVAAGTPAFVPGVKPTPTADESPAEYALRLKQYYQLMRDENLVADYVAEINAQADAAAKGLKKNTLVRGLLDAAKPIENFQEWMAQRGATMTDGSNAYTDTFLASGRVSQAHEQLTRDILRPLAKQIATIIAPDKATGKSRLDGINITWQNMDVPGTGSKIDGKALTPREIIGVYCQAKDCAEAIEKGLPDRGAKGFERNLGMTHDQIISEVESRIPRAELDEMWRLINAATHFALNYDYESGRISEDTHTEFYQREFYVPQRGWRERDESALVTEYEPVGKRGHDPYNAALVKAHGRQSLAADPFAYIMSIDASSIISSENNKIKQKFLRFCLDNEDLGLKTGAFRIKKYWIMNVIDPETGRIKLDADGNPMMEVSYSAPSTEDLQHDKETKQQIQEKRKQLSKVRSAFEKQNEHGDMPETLQAAYETKIARLEQAIEDLENQMHIAWHATNTNISQRTSDEKKQHEVQVLLDGEKYVIELQDEKLANAINKKFKQHQESLFDTTQKMRNATRFMSAMLTQYNPEFAASNFARDYQVALATLMAEHRELVGPFMKYFATCQGAVWKYAFNDKVRDREAFADSEMGQYLREYFASGAPTGFSYMQDLKSLRRDFDAMVNESNVRRGIKGAVGVFAMLTEVSETAVRFAGYVAARKNGMGINEAAYLSKELTTNFDRAGEVADTGWMAWFSFFRATLNGNLKFLKALKKMPLAYSLVAVSYFAMGMLNQFLNPDDPDDEIWASDYTRQSNFVLGKIRVPVAHFMRMFFGAGVNAAQWIQGNKTFGESVYRTADYAANEMLPDYLNVMNWFEWDENINRMSMPWDGDNYKKGVRSFIPSPLSPIADVWANRDFMGATINYKADEGTKDILLSKKNTLPVYEWLTKSVYEALGGDMNTRRKSADPAWRSWFFDNSASSVEHIVEGYMPAGVDMFATIGEAIYDAATGQQTGPDKWPFVRKFWNQYTPERAYRQQYYLLRGRVNEFRKIMNDYQKNDPAQYRLLRNSQQYRTYQQTERLVKSEKENPTTADVNALIEANKLWLK